MLFFYANPVLIAAAVLPAIFLLIQINKADKLDREPPGMILNLVFWGAVSTALAVYTERLGTTVLDALWPEDSLIYRLLMYLGGTGSVLRPAPHPSRLRRATLSQERV